MPPTTPDDDAEQTLELLTDAAHELRSPAYAIVQALQVLAETQAPAERQDLLDLIGRQARRLHALASDLLQLGAVQGAGGPGAGGTVDLTDAVAGALAGAPAPAGHRVAVDAPPGLAVLAPPLAVDRILVNLLTNAYRYGGSDIEISVRAEGDEVSIVVSDDGEGVADDLRSGLFRPYHAGAGRHPEASGLGLAIVAKLASRYGGEASYERREGRSIFRVVLPQA